jgi:molybdopterin-guanine dinucleotide biosynthesis protein B
MKEKIPAICIVAPASGYGKTQLIEGLVASLLKLGIRACVLKHAGHDLEPDTGKDTWHFRQAGAVCSAILSEDGLLLVYVPSSSLKAALALLEDFHPDLILCEGFKDSRLPKILLLKDIEEFGIIPSLDNLIAVVFDGDGPNWVKVPVVGNDVVAVMDIILSFSNMRRKT